MERTDRELLDDAALVGHLVPEGSMFAFLAEHRGAPFPDEQFADLFPSGKGRPSMPASVAASILTLHTLPDLSDADTTERTHHSFDRPPRTRTPHQPRAEQTDETLTFSGLIDSGDRYRPSRGDPEAS
ncbi:hypothetical protein DMB42_33375 [Nonomuraea sp. WAC 01424]|nr:hypothetical protein DMB42_33375 [Nonomuraea sp. WAC 01424]